MSNFMTIKRERPSVEVKASNFNIEKTFNVHDDTEIEEMYGFLNDHDHKSQGTEIKVECSEEDEHWFSSDNPYMRMPSIYRFPEMIDFAKDIIAMCRRFEIPCWLRLKMW